MHVNITLFRLKSVLSVLKTLLYIFRPYLQSTLATYQEIIYTQITKHTLFLFVPFDNYTFVVRLYNVCEHKVFYLLLSRQIRL